MPDTADGTPDIIQVTSDLYNYISVNEGKNYLSLNLQKDGITTGGTASELIKLDPQDQSVATGLTMNDMIFDTLLQDNHDAIACEMEGASVAVVCRQYDVPFVVIRAMSDKADGNAHESFDNMGDIAADNSSRIIMQMLKDD